MYQLYFLIETKKSLYIYSLSYNINIKYNFHFAFRDFFNDYEETKKRKKKKNEIHHSNRFGTFPTNKTITRESLIPRRIPSFCNYFSITTECNQLQHETLILLFLLMHMAEKIVKTHFTSNILRHTGVWQWPFISCHDVVSDRIFFDRLWRGKKVVPNGRTKKYVSLYDTKVN